MVSKDTQLVAATISTGEPGKELVYHLSDMAEAERDRLYGAGSIAMPNTLTAGEPVNVAFRFEVGETELGVGEHLRVVWRWPFDWADLQTEDGAADNYLDVQAPEHVRIEMQYEQRGGLNPWHHDIDLQVAEGTLRQGDAVVVTCADWEGPTFATDDGYFLLLVNVDGGQDWMRLSDPPRFRVVPGAAERLVVIAPGDGVVGEQAVVRVRALDAWENATPVAALDLQGEGVEIGPAVANDRFPVWEYAVVWQKAGVHRLQARVGDLTAEGNPTRVYDKIPANRIYWGDLHGGQTEIGCGAGSLDHHYAYARTVAGLQYTSQQANDHYVTKAIWDHVRKITPLHDVSGEFLAFLGCEWSPPTEDGGDRNVIYAHNERRMRRSGRFFVEHDPDPEPDLPHATGFLDVFKQKPVLLNLHVGGRPTNLAYHAPEIEPCFEIHSTHAMSEWFVLDALERGYKVGITAGTDGVMGRPGACGSGRRVTRNVRNGLTAVYAPALRQDALLNAFSHRACYGTSGARILLDVRVNGYPMGSVARVDSPPEIRIEVEGTGPIERVDILRGTAVLCSWQIAQADAGCLRVLWGGARQRGTAADQRLVWDGRLRLTNGRVFDIRPIALQCPLDWIAAVSDSEVVWTSATAGNDMGFTCVVDALPDAVLNFESAHCAFACTMAQVQRAPLIFDAGHLESRVEIGPAPREDSPKSVTLTYTDTSSLSREQSYWVRVIQTDRHRAWSSPVYVDME